MQDSIQMNIVSALSEISEDPESVYTSVIDEIERSLPDIISHLRIPPAASVYQTQIVEHRLAGKPGFRRLTAAEREKVVEELEDEVFLRSLRRAQEEFLNGIRAGTAKSTRVTLTDSSDDTAVFLDPFAETVSPKEIEISEKSSPLEPERIDAVVVSSTSDGLQGELPLEILGRTDQIDTEMAETILEVPDLPIELHESLAGRDIRGLLALIKADKLVGFMEPSVVNLIPKGVGKILVSNRRIYANLNLENLITVYHELAVSEAITDETVEEFQLLDRLIVAMEYEAQWSRLNVRRFHLINKKHSIGLDNEEVEELETLDHLAQRQMYAVQSLPFAELAMLKTYARRLGFEDGAT